MGSSLHPRLQGKACQRGLRGTSGEQAENEDYSSQGRCCDISIQGDQVWELAIEVSAGRAIEMYKHMGGAGRDSIKRSIAAPEITSLSIDISSRLLCERCSVKDPLSEVPFDDPG